MRKLKPKTSRYHKRIDLRTDHVAKLLDVSVDTLRAMINSGDLSFSGEPVSDFKMLAGHLLSRNLLK